MLLSALLALPDYLAGCIQYSDSSSLPGLVAHENTVWQVLECFAVTMVTALQKRQCGASKGVSLHWLFLMKGIN